MKGNYIDRTEGGAELPGTHVTPREIAHPLSRAATCSIHNQGLGIQLIGPLLANDRARRALTNLYAAALAAALKAEAKEEAQTSGKGRTSKAEEAPEDGRRSLHPRL